MTGVTLKQLRAFATIARERSFTRAAAQLGVSQSALTIAIRELEAELRVKLLDRSTRSVQLSPQATEFLPAIERLLGDLNHTLEDMRNLAELRKGSVVISAAASFINYVLAPAVATLAENHPGVSVRLDEDTTETVAQRVSEGEADLGITTLWRMMDSLDVQLLLRDKFGVIHPADHPLASIEGQLRWGQISPYPMVSLGRGAGVREVIDHNKAVTAILRQAAYEVSSIFVLKALIERRVGIAVLPTFAAQAILGDSLVFRPLRQPVVQRELFLIRRRGQSLAPAARQVGLLMLEQLAGLAANSDIEITEPADCLPFFT